MPRAPCPPTGRPRVPDPEAVDDARGPRREIPAEPPDPTRLTSRRGRGVQGRPLRDRRAEGRVAPKLSADAASRSGSSPPTRASGSSSAATVAARRPITVRRDRPGRDRPGPARQVPEGGRQVHPRRQGPDALLEGLLPQAVQARAPSRSSGTRRRGEWRTVQPERSDDDRASDEVKPAPPLIPPRFYDFNKIAWENKKDEVPKTIPLKNGWTIYFFSVLGEPPQGWNVDLGGVRRGDRAPALVSRDERPARSTPAPRTPDTGKVRRRQVHLVGHAPGGHAGALRPEVPGRRVPAATTKPAASTCFEFGMLDNTYVADAAKQEFIAKFANNEDEMRGPRLRPVRPAGHAGLLRVHAQGRPRLRRRSRSPTTGRRTSPSTPAARSAPCCSCAVPPPSSEWAGRKIIFDELYIKKCNAQDLRRDARQGGVNGRPIEFGIIDHRAGRITEIGSGRTHEEQYTAALKAEGSSSSGAAANFRGRATT